MRWWQPIYLIGTILTVGGIGGIGVSWYLAVWSKGVFVSEAGVGLGPVFLVQGIAMLVFLREWAGPDGNEINVNWRVEVATVVLGLLLGVANVFAVKAVVGR
ncbi:MAG: hypothetical protein FJ303_13220 [Planctomycetes bacterium]|nr:hypothetical protein [Planctomycetota bacterium]